MKDKQCVYLKISINNRSGVPIYKQIYEQIKMCIVSGDILIDSLLPSVRGLAEQLGVSVITTNKAYKKLKQGGYVYSIPAKGYFASNDYIKSTYIE